MSADAYSAIGACASAVAAICALGLTVWQCVEARRQRRETELQNRLSVRPLLVLTRVVENLEKHPLGIFITNSGLGPAIIRRISVYERSSKRVVSGEKAIAEILLPIALELEINSEVQHFWLDEGSGVRAGDTMNLLWIRPDSLKRAWMIGLMSRINIKIEYDSMYNEPCTPIYLHGPEDFLGEPSPKSK